MPGRSILGRSILGRSILAENVSDRAVLVSWLKKFVKDNPDTLNMRTYEVQSEVIAPETCEKRIHYCTLIDDENVGKVNCFISHAWGSPFKDLVSCIFRFCPDETFVWLDLFAVFQHGKDIDKTSVKGSDEIKMLDNELKFENVVREATSFLLCISPPENMEDMDPEEILAGKVVLDGDNARRIPTQRIWCLAEIMAAVSHKKPVVMGVGTAKDKLSNDFCFAKPKTMLNMLKLVNVEKAESLEPEDRVRILQSIRDEGKRLMNVENDVTWLNYAVKGALTSALTLSQCKDICGADPEDYISIFRAVISNSDTELIEDFKRKKFTEQQLNYSLTCVAGGGYTNIIKVLLKEFKLNPAAQLKSSGDTPLHYAAQGGQLETIDILKENGADLNIVNHHGWSALVYAATDGQVKSVEKLKEIGADMNVTSGNYAKGMTTVMYCLAGNKLDILQTLKKCGADLDLQTADGITAVMFAVAADHKEGNENDWRFLKELVKGKANLDMKTTKKGRTALMWAVQNNRVDAAQILLESGAKVNETDVQGLTPLMLAVQEGHKGPAELLRKFNADVHLKDNKGWTCTDWETNTQRVALKRAKMNEVISKDIEDPLPKGANENRCDSHGTRYMWNLRNKLLRAGTFEERIEYDTCLLC